jgi:hypothetical protein
MPDENRDYEQCPFCDRVFLVEYGGMVRAISRPGWSPIQQHIQDDHHKVRLRKGSNYKWIDASAISGNPPRLVRSAGVTRPRTKGRGTR